MFEYFRKRLFSTIPTILIVLVFVFFFIRLIPGDPARLAAGEDATLEQVEMTREKLGLDQPVTVQFKDYVVRLLHGDLGISLRTGSSINQSLKNPFKNTIKLTLVSILWSAIVGVLLGVWSARYRGKWQDYTGMTLAVSGISMPSFWIGFLLITLFSVKLKWLPTTGAGSFKHLILPAISLGTGIAAIVARFTRSSMVEMLGEDFVRTARAKGASEGRVSWVHAFRNSLVSVVTVVGLQFGFLLGGSVVIENVFGFPGLGFELVTAVAVRDYPMIQALILIFSLNFILINFIVDILYAVLNPEIRLGEKA